MRTLLAKKPSVRFKIEQCLFTPFPNIFRLRYSFTAQSEQIGIRIHPVESEHTPASRKQAAFHELPFGKHPRLLDYIHVTISLEDNSTDGILTDTTSELPFYIVRYASTA